MAVPVLAGNSINRVLPSNPSGYQCVWYQCMYLTRKAQSFGQVFFCFLSSGERKKEIKERDRFVLTGVSGEIFLKILTLFEN